MSEKNRLRDFNYDMDEFIGFIVHRCFIMGISEVVVEFSLLEMQVVEEYCKNMIRVSEEYSSKLTESRSMIYYEGKKIIFKPE